MLLQNIQIQDRDKFHYPLLEAVSVNYLYTFKNDLLVNTSENQILLVARLLEGCHNKSSFTLRLLHGLKGNLMMLGKSQELLIFAPKNIYIKNFLQSTSDLR